MTPTELYNDPSLIDWNNPVVIDFESYYDKEWSLSKITTEKYIRGDQWECIGVSIKVGSNPAKFFRNETGIPIIAELIKRFPTSPFLAHNCQFDYNILAWRYGLRPNFIVDTALMAKVCGLDRVAGATSLAKLSDRLEKMGIVSKVKGTTVHDMLGVHAADMTPKQWEDYAAYCVLDSDLCYALYVYMIDKVPTSELVMIDITTRMATTPAIELNVPLLQDYAVRLENEREAKLGAIASDLGFKDNASLLSNLRSSKKFVALLERLNVEVPMKWSEKKQEMIPAVSKTDLAFLDLLEHDDELVRTLVETKLGTMSSMEQTRTATFLDVASRGLCPIPLRYASAHTGRYGGMDKLNFQNLSKRTKEPVLRRSMTAGQGNVLLATDSSSIEARLLAFVADQKDLVDTFVQGRDVYVEMATKIYNKTYDEIFEVSKRNPTKEGKAMRNMGKACILGCGYSMSGLKFALTNRQQGIDMSDDYATELVTIYRTSYPMIPAFWRECNRALDVMYAGGSMWFGGPDNNLFFADGASEFHGVKIPSIRLPNGAYIWYQNLRKEAKEDGRVNYVYDQFKGRNWLPKWVFGGSLCENLVQALAFVLLKHQAIEIAKRGVPINLNVHDEWVSVVPRSQAAYAAQVHYECMRNVPSYVPQGLLDCEVDIGLNYSDTKTLNMAKLIGA